MDSKKLKLIIVSLFLGFGLWACNSNHHGSASHHNILSDTLSNGLKVVIIRDTLAPMVTTQMTYLAGGYETPAGYPGTAHAMEHMMFRNSKGMSAAQLYEMLGKLGGRYNAFTTMDATQYFLTAPSRYLDILLHIGSIRMNSALISKHDWSLEKGAIEQEVSRDISNPGYLASLKADSILFAGTGYAHSALGTRPSFDKTTPAILRKFYNQWYVPNNAIFVIAGDINPKRTFSKVKQLFGSIPRKATPARTSLKLENTSPQTIHKTTPRGTGSVEFMYRMPGYRSKDFAASKILLDALNNARSSLSKLSVEGKVLSSFAGFRPFGHTGIGIIEAGFAKGHNPKKTQADMDSVISHVLKNGVPDDLVKAAKQSELAQFEFDKNSAMSLASAWSNAMAWRGLPSLQAAEQQIREVTPGEVNKIVQKYLKTGQRVTIVLTPNPNGKRPPNSNGFGGTESFAGNAKLDVSLPSWASQPLSSVQMPHWTLNPTKMKLNNGITLIVQPENVSKTVTIRGHIDNNSGLQAPHGQEGVGQLLGALFDYGNTDMNRNAFHKALDKISATEHGGTSFSLAVPSKHFKRGMQLLADNELHPALPDSGFKVKQKTIARRLKGRMQSPSYKLNRAILKGLYPAGDPQLRHATPSSVKSLTLQDVKNYFSKTYRPDMTTIVIVGDVTPKQAKSTVKKYFGGWKATGPKPQVIPKPVPLNKAATAFVKNSYASQDKVIIAQNLPLNLGDSVRYTLQLGNEVLGGNGFASRLMLDIRTKHGYAYGAGSGMNFGRSRSLFFVSYGSDPDKVGLVNSLIFKNIKEMQSDTIKATEMKNARQAELRGIPASVSSVNAIARSLLSWSWHGEPLNEPMVAAKHYLHTSPKQIEAAFKKYLKPDHFVQVVEGPKPDLSNKSGSVNSGE
jgi:zinc protease